MYRKRNDSFREGRRVGLNFQNKDFLIWRISKAEFRHEVEKFHPCHTVPPLTVYQQTKIKVYPTHGTTHLRPAWPSAVDVPWHPVRCRSDPFHRCPGQQCPHRCPYVPSRCRPSWGDPPAQSHSAGPGLSLHHQGCGTGHNRQ